MINSEKTKTRNMVMTAMMMGLIMAMTIVIRIPVPATHGYIHLGDCMIFIAVLLLGWKRGAAAAGLGSALADIIGGFAVYAPVTFAAAAGAEASEPEPALVSKIANISSQFFSRYSEISLRRFFE